MKKYKTVVIDFPWMVKNSTETLKRERKPIYRRAINPEKHNYPRMTLEEIRNFPIDDFADEESLLFIWVTLGREGTENIPIIKAGFDILEQHGFTYSNTITWCKPQGVACFSPIINMTEHCLFGYRGNFPKLFNEQYAKMKSWIHTHQQLVHSQKPVQFYQLLRRFTPEPRIDVFARRVHVGFDGWGDQYAGDHGPLLKFI